MIDVLDARVARRWAVSALSALGHAREEIDALNVYPVPDGDTGTNLYLTLEAACASVLALPAGAAYCSENFATDSAAISHTAPLTSPARPATAFSSAWLMKPSPMPVAIEKVKGMAMAVTMAGM